MTHQRQQAIYTLIMALLLAFVIIGVAVEANGAPADPESRDVEVPYILDEVPGVGDLTQEEENVVLQDILDLVSLLPWFQKIVSWLVIALAVLAVLNYIALLTPVPWDDAIIGPLYTLVTRLYLLLRRR